MKPHELKAIIIILIGALILAMTSCTNQQMEGFSVKVRELGGGYIICVYGERYLGYEPINEYYNTSNKVNAIFFDDRDSAINLARHFNTFEKVKHWNDSVQSLVIKPKLIPNEQIIIY